VESLLRTATTIPHNLVKPLIGLRVAFHGLLMLLFDLLYIFRRSVAFMPNSGKQVSKRLFRARRMVNCTLKKSNADHLPDPFRV
jgi:hypothetical protein